MWRTIYNTDSYQNISNNSLDINRKTKKSSFVILLVLIISYLVFLNPTIFQYYYYKNLGFYFNFSIIAITFIIKVIWEKKIYKDQSKNMLFAFILFIYCLLNVLFFNGGFRYIGCIVNTIILCFIMQSYRISRKLLKLHIFIILIVLFYLSTKASNYFESQYLENVSINSNYIGTLALALIIHMNISLEMLNIGSLKKTKIIKSIVLIIGFYIILGCKSRGNFLALSFYTFLIYLFPIKIISKPKFIKFTSIFMILFGIFFSYFYISYFAHLGIKIMGRSTLTRYRLWNYFYENIFLNINNFLFGFGTRGELRKIFGYGMHHIYLGIWYDIGFIGLILIIIFILSNIFKAVSELKFFNRVQIFSIVGFLSFLVSDCFAVTFTGPLIIWNYFTLGLTMYQINYKVGGKK